MSRVSESYQVVIAGGGPVGLFLAICLEKVGISTLILEKRTHIRSGSRSLGIHPVSLELFEQQGIANRFVNTGIKISKGHAFANDQKLGTISFEDCPRPFNYILALPQDKTEALLEEAAIDLNQDILVRDAEVTEVNQTSENVEVRFCINGEPHRIKTSFLVGCDGKDSFIRQQANISFEGDNYPDTYIMGDFSDNTSFGTDAAIFLCDGGVIESFPLLSHKRRWVIKTDEYISDVQRSDIEKRLASRIGHDLGQTEHFMLSSFGVQKFIAQPMFKNRIIMAGDAAHVVSPIGGQGMNLGWLGASDLAHSLDEIFNRDKSSNEALGAFEQRRTKAAGNAIFRAEINMRLGRKVHFPIIRNSAVYVMLHTPLSKLMARIYTMRGVEQWIT